MARRDSKRGGGSATRDFLRDMARKRATERKRDSGGNYLKYDGEYFNPTEKETFDIIPYEVTDPHHPEKIPVGQLWFRRPFKVHKNVGPNDTTLVCPSSIGKKCPICEEVKALIEEGYNQNKKTIDALRAKDRELFNISSSKDPDKIKLWDISLHLFGKQLDKEIADGDDDVAAFSDPDDGLSLRCRFEKKTYNKKEFFSIDRIDFIDRVDPVTDDMLKEATNLDEILEIMSYNEIKEIFYGVPDDQEENADRIRGKHEEPEEEPEPTRRSRRREPEEEEPEPPRRTRRSREPEPEEEPEPPRRARREPDPEPEDEKPARTGSSRRKPPSAKKEEEPEEPPRRSRREAPKNEDECPHGLTFGVDADAEAVCEKCKVWDACIERQEELNKKK